MGQSTQHCSFNFAYLVKHTLLHIPSEIVSTSTAYLTLQLNATIRHIKANLLRTRRLNVFWQRSRSDLKMPMQPDTVLIVWDNKCVCDHRYRTWACACRRSKNGRDIQSRKACRLSIHAQAQWIGSLLFTRFDLEPTIEMSSTPSMSSSGQQDHPTWPTAPIYSHINWLRPTV